MEFRLNRIEAVLDKFQFKEEKDEMILITSLVTKFTYDNLATVAEREGLNMNDIVEYCLSNNVHEFS